MGADFYMAAIPEPVVILGIRLRSFSLGHLLLLNRFDNAFGTGKTATIGDLVQAIVICSQSYEDALADLDSPTLPDHVAKWQKKIQPRNALGFRKRGLGFSPIAKMTEFRSYVDAGSSFPVFSVPQDKQGGGISIPFVQSVKVTLQSKLHLSESEVLNRPWGLCLFDFFTLHAMEGNCKLEEETGDEFKAIKAKADALHARVLARAGRG